MIVCCIDMFSPIGDILFDNRDVVLPPDIVLGSNKQSFSPQIETIRVGVTFTIYSAFPTYFTVIPQMGYQWWKLLIKSDWRIAEVVQRSSTSPCLLQSETTVWAELVDREYILYWSRCLEQCKVYTLVFSWLWYLMQNFADEKTVFLIPLSIDFTKLPAYINKVSFLVMAVNCS